MADGNDIALEIGLIKVVLYGRNIKLLCEDGVVFIGNVAGCGIDFYPCYILFTTVVQRVEFGVLGVGGDAALGEKEDEINVFHGIVD